jgi:FMN-dependent NADH-azoreductase
VKVLEIQSSPQGESSDSITLTKSFIEACKSDNTSIVVDTLNVWHERLPEFDSEANWSEVQSSEARNDD